MVVPGIKIVPIVIFMLNRLPCSNTFTVLLVLVDEPTFKQMMRFLLSAITVLLVAVSVKAQQWTYKGLGGMITNQLTIHNDSVYASTSNGLYKTYLFGQDTVWQQVSMNGRSVLNTLFLDQNECLLLVATDPLSHQAVLYTSMNCGATSSVFLPDTVYYAYPNLAHIASSPHGKDTIYSSLHNKKTFDGGLTWTTMNADPYAGNFVCVNPAYSKEVFTGGENMIFSASLQHSSNNGVAWQEVNCSTVFAGDNAFEVLHVIGDEWFGSGEGIVVKKHKDSSDWTQILNVYSDPSWALYMFGFDISPADNNYLYVSGDNSGPNINNKLRLFKSSNRGASWDSISYTIPQQTVYGVNDLKVQHVWGEDRVWMGGRGVFTFAQGVTTGVDDKVPPAAGAILYPNPAKGIVYLNPGKQTLGEPILVTILNNLGQTLRTIQTTAKAQMEISLENLADGMYYLHLQGKGSETLRFLKSGK